MFLTSLRINVAAVSARLSTEQRRYVDSCEVERWLARKGFTRYGEDWYGDSRAAHHLLRRNEILGDGEHADNGVTFNH